MPATHLSSIPWLIDHVQSQGERDKEIDEQRNKETYVTQRQLTTGKDRSRDWQRQGQRLTKTGAETGTDRGRDWHRQRQRLTQTGAETDTDRSRDWHRQGQRLLQTGSKADTDVRRLFCSVVGWNNSFFVFKTVMWHVFPRPDANRKNYFSQIVSYIL